MTGAGNAPIVSVYALFADEQEARRIGAIAVEERLAACVNLLGPCHSIYRWQGKVESATEMPAIFKARGVCAQITISRPHHIPAPATACGNGA